MQRFDAPWHFHPEIELTLIISSRDRRFVGDSIEPFDAGDLVLLGPNLPHFWHNEGQQDSETPAQSVVCQFERDSLGPSCGVPASASALSTRVFRPYWNCWPYLSSLPPRIRAAYVPSLDSRAEERLARVHAFLMRHFKESLSLAEIARVAAMTPAAFSRYFKRATGRNVSTFLNELRIDHAGQLLRDTRRSVAEVGFASSFATLSNFNRRFRERMERNPREYRRIFAQAELAPRPARFQPLEGADVFGDTAEARYQCTQTSGQRLR